MAKRGNYNILGKYGWCIPDGTEIFFLILLLLLGTLIGIVFVSILMAIMGQEAIKDYTTLLSYPIMFIPAMIWAAANSRSNRYRQKGLDLDNANVAPLGWGICICLTVLGTIGVGIVSDVFQRVLPPMPAWLEKVMGSLLDGNILINFICVSIFAPFFEEWLCRGMIERGLLGRGTKPVWAIVISAVIFAVIHMNPWQALPAFIMGLLFGYIYYKTGSLKLTMLAHFTNNTLALVVGNIESLKGCNNYMDALGSGYWYCFAASILVIIMVVRSFSTLPVPGPRGAFKVLPSAFDE